ncbi:phosphoesterase-domain-containing protein [Aureobasidium sp. EXF-3400]|nr:phosphoesterase-domain-containing protein [Aureobasidium sp. EXF-12344]KAI4775434.1 phosphoesterase-domain-containing protein [Aureobasidium sp. EXF-3400]
MFYSTLIVSAITLSSQALAANLTSTTPADVDAARNSALTLSPTSNVKGKVFDRFVTIWLENTDYDKAASDPNLAWLAKKGITLSNYNGVTHPSEPNYVASIGGDNFGMDNDDFNQIPGNVSSIIDLLEDKGIAWSQYQEDMPYSGFEGKAWINQQTKANDYVRKHNPAVIYDANTSADRLAKNKNLTQFYSDLEAKDLPQWMFITPNMTSDGHDTSVTTAGAWTRNFLEPLLNDKHFMKNTLVLVTFDESHTYTLQNRVFSFLLGDALPKKLIGTTDSQFYNHYSEISTVEANWNLHTLGRWDVGANIFSFVADKTGDENTPWDAASGPNSSHFFNSSFSGPFSDDDRVTTLPVPNTKLVRNGRKVLGKIARTWGDASLQSQTYYQNTVQIPDGMHPPQGW